MKTGCVILAGGKSSRMGEDKALLTYEGKNFVEKIAEELNFFEEKMIARGNNPVPGDFVKKDSWEVLPDEYENHGPLGGLHAALKKCRSDAMFVVTCDIPLISKRLVKEICDIENYPNADDELKAHLENFKKTVEIARSLGMEVDEVSVDRKLLNAVFSVYRVIHSAEATSNMSNLTGIIFGPRGEGDNYIDMIKDHRTKGFSPLIKRRFVIGSYVLQKENQERYFKNAQRARRMIVDTWKELYKKYDAVLCPVGVGPAKKLDELNKEQDINTMALDEHLQVGNFGGFPSITIPNGFVSELPVGVNITGNCYEDEKVLNIAYALESAMEYKGQYVKEVK